MSTGNPSRVNRNDEELELSISSVHSTTEMGEASLCFGLIRQYLQNLVKEPKEDKYRQINTSNVNYIWKIGSINGGTQIFLALGFKQETFNGKEGSYPALLYKDSDIERLNRACQRLQEEEERIRILIARIPRKAIFGQKKPSRAFLEFQGSTRFTVGFSDTIGQRQRMEDEIVILGMGPRCRKNEDYYAIFDGHGGSEASMFAAQELHKRLDKCLRLNGGDIIQALVKAFHETNHTMCQVKDMICGSCALVSYFSDNRMYIANLGDSRAVLGRRSRGTRRLTRDHKPTDELELQRIQRLGGYVQIQQKDFGRVMGTLSVSRALGDKNLKPYVSHDPDIFIIDLTENDYFLILACDGIWDKLTDEEAVMITFDSKDPQTASDAIIKSASQKGGTDNASVIIIFLKDRCEWIDVPDEILEEDVQIEHPYEITDVLYSSITGSVNHANSPTLSGLAKASYDIVYAIKPDKSIATNPGSVRTTGVNLSNSRKNKLTKSPNEKDSANNPTIVLQEPSEKTREVAEHKINEEIKRSKGEDSLNQEVHLNKPRRSKSIEKKTTLITTKEEIKRSKSARFTPNQGSKSSRSSNKSRASQDKKKRRNATRGNTIAAVPTTRERKPEDTPPKRKSQKKSKLLDEPRNSPKTKKRTIKIRKDDEPEDKEDSTDKTIKKTKLKIEKKSLSNSSPPDPTMNVEEKKKKKKKKKDEQIKVVTVSSDFEKVDSIIRAKTAPSITKVNEANTNNKTPEHKTPTIEIKTTEHKASNRNSKSLNYNNDNKTSNRDSKNYSDYKTPNSDNKASNRDSKIMNNSDHKTFNSDNKTSNRDSKIMNYSDHKTPNSDNKTSNRDSKTINYNDHKTPNSDNKTLNSEHKTSNRDSKNYSDYKTPNSDNKASNRDSKIMNNSDYKTPNSENKTSNRDSKIMNSSDHKTPNSDYKTLNSEHKTSNRDSKNYSDYKTPNSDNKATNSDNKSPNSEKILNHGEKKATSSPQISKKRKSSYESKIQKKRRNVDEKS